MFPFNTSLAFRVTIIALLSFVLLLKYKPMACYFVYTMAIGFYFLYYGFNALRKGEIDIRSYTRYSTYNRRNNPIEFWLYIFIFGVLGITACISSVYFTFH